MNSKDIESLDTRINSIWVAKSNPEIILAGKEETSLNKLASTFSANRCNLILLYNEVRTRTSNGRPITLEQIIQALGHGRAEDTSLLVDIIKRDKYLTLIAGNTKLLDKLAVNSTSIPDVILDPVLPQAAHIFAESMSVARMSIPDIYSILKSSLSITGKLLSQEAVIGALSITLNDKYQDKDGLYIALSALEAEDSPLYLTQSKYLDIIVWYRERMTEYITRPIKRGNPTKPNQLGFYSKSLTDLDKKVPIIDMDAYDIEPDKSKYIISPIKPIDIVDVISKARTSATMPLIVGYTQGFRITKSFDASLKKDVAEKIKWFTGSEPGTMRIYIRITKHPERFQMVKYYEDKGYFAIEIENKYLALDDIVSIMCAGLGLDVLTLPKISSTTYTFVSSYLMGNSHVQDSGRGNSAIPGLDRHVLAWLITNPPPEYKESGIDKYVFIMEDTEPNALKDRINVHIQLGPNKMYLSLSANTITNGTLVPYPQDTSTIGELGGKYMGFKVDEKYLRVRINKCPSESHARICHFLYMHIMTMYITYYAQTREKIAQIAKVKLGNLNPRLQLLTQRIPSLRDRYLHHDPILYKYISNIKDDESLPVPILASEASKYREEGYAVMRLPSTILNFPSIEIETNGEVWIRANQKNMPFFLVPKDKNGYIPLTGKAGRGAIKVSIGDNWIVTGEISVGTNTYVNKKSTGSITGKVGKKAEITDALSKLLKPYDQPKQEILRLGVPPNMLSIMKTALGNSASGIEVSMIADYAHMCKQECWDQSVDEIVDDILSLRIDPLRHFRALEQAYKVNLFFMQDDTMEPHLIIPGNALFYIHRRANPDWPCIILHRIQTLKSKDVDTFTILIRYDANNKRIISHTFDKPEYLDSLMDRVNVVTMVSPVDESIEYLQHSTIPQVLGDWIAIGQIIDEYGKCQAFVYQNGNESVATVRIGFLPPQNLPIMRIIDPTLDKNGVPLILKDFGGLDILHSVVDNEFRSWQIQEKEARTLRSISQLLYSRSSLTASEFGENHIIVDSDIKYDLRGITNKLPPPNSGIWEYFVEATKNTMVNENDEIIVPDEDTKQALILYLGAFPKMVWPRYFPSFIKYNWDIYTGPEESVFINDLDMIQHIIVLNEVTQSSDFVVSSSPYILDRDDNRYLVQMANNMEHAQCIAYNWQEYKINPGIIDSCRDLPIMSLPKLDPAFTQTVIEPSYTIYNGATYVILPLE